jgi:hypothetical protein
MRTLALVACGALVACKDDPRPAPRAQPTAPADARVAEPALKLVRCTQALPAPPHPFSRRIGDVGLDGRGSRAGRGLGVIDRHVDGGAGSTVTFGALATSGPLRKQAVAKTLRDHAGRLSYCYEQRLVQQPSLAGTSELTLTIEPDGSVFEAHVEGRFDDELALCVKHLVSELKFPVAARAARSTAKQQLVFAWQTPSQPVATPSVPPALWTPFAASPAHVPASVAEPAARGIGRAIPLAKVDACFGDANGALRSMLTIAADGSVIAARSGGVGNVEIEACASTQLVGIKAAPVELITEVACDFIRGDPAPWRVALDAGYIVVDAAQPLPASREDPTSMYLIVLDSGTNVAKLQAALAMASTGAAALVALRADGGAPLYVASTHAAAPPDPTAPLVLDTGDPLRICGGVLDQTAEAAFNDADKLVAAATRSCTHRPCPAQLRISLGGSRTARHLAALAGVSRSVGFERLVFATVACPR